MEKEKTVPLSATIFESQMKKLDLFAKSLALSRSATIRMILNFQFEAKEIIMEMKKE